MTQFLYILYRVASHNRNNVPDGREAVFTGTADEVIKEWESYSAMCRNSDMFLAGAADEEPEEAIGMSWFVQLHEELMT